MKTRILNRWVVGCVCLGLLAGFPAVAEDISKKWRIGFAAGGMNGQDEIDSASANQLVLFDQNRQVVALFEDPRDSSSVFGSLDLQPGPIATLSAQYAVNKIFVIEASAGYHKTDLGDIEMQAQFSGVPIDPDFDFNFATFRIPAGEIERIPLALTAMARFRPRASFNPYVGAGIGYSIIGFETSDELNLLSQRMDASRGGLARVNDSFRFPPSLTVPSAAEFSDLEGAVVNATDTWEWHTVIGAELTVKNKWSLFFDARWTFSGRSVEIGFNGGDELGSSVPRLLDRFFSPAGRAAYGGIQIDDGGLIDGGSLVPIATEDPATDCGDPLNAQLCVFEIGTLDGELDPGVYYVQGGKIRADALSAQFGFRYTF